MWSKKLGHVGYDCCLGSLTIFSVTNKKFSLSLIKELKDW